MTPNTEAELAEILSAAKAPLAIQGGGTRVCGLAGNPLSTTSLTGITLYEPGALTMVAKAGTPLAEIEAALNVEGQMLAFEPYDLSGVTRVKSQSTIGGVFATNASGARRLQVGAARDFLLGVRFVDGTGSIVKNGGRVMKNVTGYDLVKLLAGSYGVLGVLSEVSFKVLPKPETQAVIQIEGLSDAMALRAMTRAVCSAYDVSAAEHYPACIEEIGCTSIRVEGFAESVAYRSEKLKSLLAEFGEIHIAEGHESSNSSQALVMFSQTVRGSGGTLWRISAKPSDTPLIMGEISQEHDVLYSYDHAGGRVWVWSREAEIPKLHRDLQGALARWGGHATLVHSETHPNLPKFQPEPAAIAKISAGLRAKFDPKGILNTGLMGGAG